MAGNTLLSDNTNNNYRKMVGFSDTIGTTLDGEPSNVSPYACSWDGTNLISDNADTSHIFRHVGFTDNVGTDITVAATPANLTWDGTNVITANNTTQYIIKYTGFTNTPLDTFAPNDDTTYGVAWDGTNVIDSCYTNQTIHKYSGFSSTVVTTLNAVASSGMFGPGWDSDNLLSSGYTSDTIYKHTGFSETIAASFAYADVTQPGDDSWSGVPAGTGAPSWRDVVQVIANNKNKLPLMGMQ